MTFNLNKTFFVRRYLFTTNEEHHLIYKNEITRWQYAVANDGLSMSFTEYFSLPLYIRDLILTTQKEISAAKSARIESLT